MKTEFTTTNNLRHALGAGLCPPALTEFFFIHGNEYLETFVFPALLDVLHMLDDTVGAKVSRVAGAEWKHLSDGLSSTEPFTVAGRGAIVDSC